MKLVHSIFFLLLSTIACIYFMPAKYSLFDKSGNIVLPLICLINVIIFFRTVNRYYTSWFRYDVLFIIGFLIVHFQIPFLEAIGISPIRPDFIWIDKEVVNFATWFSTIVLFCWMFGFYIFLFLKKNVTRQNAIKLYYVKKHFIIDLLLVSSFGIFLILAGSSFLSGNYAGSENWGGGTTYVFVILRVTITLSIIYFFINYRGKLSSKGEIINAISENKILVVVITMYLLIFLMVGDRGPVMQIIIMILTGYTLFHRKVSLSKLVFLLVFGSMFLTLLKFGRTRDVTERDGNIISAGYENLQNDDNPLNPTNELASSVRILYRALDVVPDYHPYLYGTTLMSNIVDVVPFSSRFYQVPAMYTNSTTFFTVLGQGQFYSYGEGSEIIADLYINLGFWLTLLVFLFFGYFISFLTFEAHYYRGRHVVLIIYFLLIASAIYINRSNFLNPLKIIVYAIIVDRLFTTKLPLKI